MGQTYRTLTLALSDTHDVPGTRSNRIYQRVGINWRSDVRVAVITSMGAARVALTPSDCLFHCVADVSTWDRLNLLVMPVATPGRACRLSLIGAC